MQLTWERQINEPFKTGVGFQILSVTKKSIGERADYEAAPKMKREMPHDFPDDNKDNSNSSDARSPPKKKKKKKRLDSDSDDAWGWATYICRGLANSVEAEDIFRFLDGKLKIVSVMSYWEFSSGLENHKSSTLLLTIDIDSERKSKDDIKSILLGFGFQARLATSCESSMKYSDAPGKQRFSSYDKCPRRPSSYYSRRFV